MRVKRKQVFDAWQWNETKTMLAEMEKAGVRMMSSSGHRDRPDECANLRIDTAYGTSPIVGAGTWIVTDDAGEVFLCDKATFWLRFETA